MQKLRIDKVVVGGGGVGGGGAAAARDPTRSAADIYWQAMMCAGKAKAGRDREGETRRIDANANCGKCARKERNTIMCAAYEATHCPRSPPNPHPASWLDLNQASYRGANPFAHVMNQLTNCNSSLLLK